MDINQLTKNNTYIEQEKRKNLEKKYLDKIDDILYLSEDNQLEEFKKIMDDLDKLDTSHKETFLKLLSAELLYASRKIEKPLKIKNLSEITGVPKRKIVEKHKELVKKHGGSKIVSPHHYMNYYKYHLNISEEENKKIKYYCKKCREHAELSSLSPSTITATIIHILTDIPLTDILEKTSTVRASVRNNKKELKKVCEQYDN